MAKQKQRELDGYLPGMEGVAVRYIAAGAAGSVPATIVDWDNLNCRRFRVKVAVVYAANNALLTLWTRHKAL